MCLLPFTPGGPNGRSARCRWSVGGSTRTRSGLCSDPAQYQAQGSDWLNQGRKHLLDRFIAN